MRRKEGKRDEKRGVMLHGAAPRREGRWALGAQTEGCALGGRITSEAGEQ